VSSHDPDTILTDGSGRPIPRPERKYYPEGIEGDIAFLRAYGDYTNHVNAVSCRAFAEAFSKAVRR
jgi:hypothetical protein